MTEKAIVAAEEIATLVEKLATEIAGEGKDLDGLAIIGIHKRGVPLAQRLVRYIEKARNTKVDFGSLDITLYRDDFSASRSQPRVHATQIEFNVAGKRIVLVDDVLYTGRTIRAALSEIIDFGRPGRIELAVLVDRGHQELPIKADYVGKTVETSPSQMVEVRFEETDGEDKVLLIDKGD
jgi:pyrimidine operon attenuation protein/uracil phosphoribosyltransferase